MTTQAGIQAPPQSSSGKKWFMGCGIALLVVILAGGGFVYWGVQKSKAFFEEWGENPGLAAVAAVVKMDDTYEIVDKDLKAGTLTVKETASGEVSVWTLNEIKEGSETVELTDDKGRIVTMGGSSGKAFTITEPSAEDADASEGDTEAGEAPVEEAPAEVEAVEETVEVVE